MSDHVLGRTVEYPQQYDPKQLRREERSINRLKYDIHDDNLPFGGFDVWHCYEISFLTNNSCPINKVGKIVYPCESKYIVESKSLKLYLNSFNMTKFGPNIDIAIKTVEDIVKLDLSQFLGCDVKFKLFDTNITGKPYSSFPYYFPSERTEFTVFNEDPSLLQIYEKDSVHELRFNSDFLRSNCKITHQPDWGDIFIHIRGRSVPDTTSLLKYIVSFRNENHFHEEVVEMIYKRLWDIFTPQELMVGAIYTRRGGIDICPCRSTHHHLLDKIMINPYVLPDKLIRQ
jgi:7-cyano-7-deazaguanine reductase